MKKPEAPTAVPTVRLFIDYAKSATMKAQALHNPAGRIASGAPLSMYARSLRDDAQRLLDFAEALEANGGQWA